MVRKPWTPDKTPESFWEIIHKAERDPERLRALLSLRLAKRALMMRIVSLPSRSLLTVYTTISVLPSIDLPSRFDLASLSECSLDMVMHMHYHPLYGSKNRT